MKISHETPIVLFEESLEFNDYQYALVHLFDEQPEYLRHFEKCRDEGVPVLLDNSIFELGEAFDAETFVKWIERMKPDEYVIPDVLGDAKGTMKNLDDWNKKYWDVPGVTIGVVQGKTYEEIVECYNHIDTWCDKIAIPFHLPFYEESEGKTKLHRWFNGRQNLLRRMLAEGIINQDKPHHLLGCSFPQEFKEYRSYKWIESVDTSNPIVHGLLGIKYSDWGLDIKKSIKLCDLIESPIENSGIIAYNISKFREFVNG